MPIAGPRSRSLFTAAKRVIPGGVNSPVRAWKRLGGCPPMISSGKGAWLTDADGRRFVDYVLSWGPLLHGHAHPATVRAVRAAAGKGLTFGAPIAAEAELARLICSAFPGMDQVRMVSSGTEATMSALRLARAATGRDLVVKCDGCYHGHADHLLVAAGSGCATLGQPDSAGVPAAFASCTISVPYNDAAAMAAAFKAHGKRIAAVIVEPVAGNMGLVLPQPGWLEGLRTLCDRHGALLVFDEVMTGFRVGWGGWQNACGVRPDLTCLGKVVGGGMPLGAYGGRRDLMRQLAPEGPCYQAGTLSGTPVAVAAGLAALQAAAKDGFYGRVATKATRLILGLRELAAANGQRLQFSQAGTMWGYFFSPVPVTDFASAAASDTARWATFCTAMVAKGVYLAPSPFEAAFISAAHGPRELAHTLRAAEHAFAQVRKHHG
jgi:glutamate-1-semialdehyde 2,1-aminomutase